MIRDWKRYCKLLRPRIVRKYVSKKYWCGICQFIHYVHSKWDLVGYSGGSPGLENAVKRWGRPIGPICISVYFDTSPCFSPTSEFTGLSIEAKCKPMENAVKRWAHYLQLILLSGKNARAWVSMDFT